MKVEEVFTVLKELGHNNSKREDLREYCRSKIDLILKYLSNQILNSDGGDLLDCIFNGLSDNATKYKIKVVDIVLQSMTSHSTSLAHCSNVISRLCLELPRLPAEELVRWCNNTVQSIVGDSDVNLIWKDVLPECLNALSSETSVKHCGTELTYTEYKEQCIHTLCQCNWTEKQLVQLAAMFKDMQLSKNTHKQVVNKICSYIIDLPPDSLPPLVHQLLKLCKTNHMELVLAHLSHYFSARLYSKLEPPPQDSESTTMDIDDIVPYSPIQLSRCLSTCLYHISQGAAEPEVVKKHLKQWPKTQLLRSPFIIDLALAMSDKGSDYRTACLDVIRSAIEQRVMDEQRCNESAWVRSVMPPDVDVASVLKVLTTESSNHRQLTAIGLIHLAFSLLAVSKTKPVAQACWSHGKLILVRLCKSQQETTGYILSQLADKLAGETTQKQYADCLHVLCKLTPLSVERCSQLRTILENCQPNPHDYKPAAAVLDAVHPLINYSTRTRDTLIMVCRKGLYSRDSIHRCLALSGFLTVLKRLKLSPTPTDSVCSDQFSAHSYLTQLTVDLHATQQGAVVTSRVRNEAMCYEVVSIVRRCLQQDAAVKILLYSKIFTCVKEKPMLHEAVLEMLYEHLNKYMTEEGNKLMMEKCVQLTATSATLTEPISRLIYSIAEFLQPSEEEDLEDILSSQASETGCTYLKTQLNNVLDKFSADDGLGRIDMEDPSITDLTPESKAKSIKVQQTLLCYEALIAHHIMQWTINSANAANTVFKLFKASNQLLENTKTPTKMSKKNSKTSLNETKETVKSQKSQKSQDKNKGPVKLSALTKDRAGPFKPLPSLWDLKLCYRVLELLYSENVQWSSVEQRNILRSCREFHHFTLRNVLSVLTSLSSDGADKRTVAQHVPTVASLLYRRCLCRFQDMCDFDELTAIGCVDAFKQCLTLLFSANYSLKMDVFLPVITGLQDGTNTSNIAEILEQIHKALSRLDEDGIERDANTNKLVVSLSHTANLLLERPVHSCSKLTSVIIKLEQYVRKSKQDCCLLLPSLLLASRREQQEAPLVEDLILKLTCVLGKIDEEESSTSESSEFPFIDDAGGGGVLEQVSGELRARCDAADALCVRARDLAAALPLVAHHQANRIQKELKEVYACIVLQACQVCGLVRGACGVRGAGRACTGVLAAAVRLYRLLAAVVRHVPLAVAPHLRLDRLIKLSGKKLSTVMDNLITYSEASQQQQTANKVLRDTKLIPRLVFETEHFGRNVILLDDKAKLNLQQYLSLGTARDFRIRAPVLQEVLNNIDQDNEETRDDAICLNCGASWCREDGMCDNYNINDAITEILSPTGSDNEADENNEQARKRRRVS